MARKKITGTVAAISLVFVMAILIEELIDNDDTKDRDRYRVGDYTLEIFGNANGDWYIDHDDVAFLKRIIVGEEEETVFADANRDGALDAGDVEQVNRIIAGTANAVWIVDGNGNPVKVNLPVRRIGVEYLSNAELMNVLGVSDRVMAADAAVYIMKDVYFPGRELLNMGQMHQNPDFETITGMELDILFTFSPYDNELKQEKLPGTDVVFLGLYRSNVIEPRSSRFLQGVLKAGYILGASGRAYDYMEWLLGIVGRIGSVTSSLPEEARPSVLMTSYNRYFADSKDFSAAVYTRIDPLSQACILAGGKPIAEDLNNWIGEGNTYGIIADLEWIIERDPRFIFVHSVRAAY
ncbi:MAG TPA: ABC transporter substrate-binding protein, partial [Candidatus Krumholzibacteriaceae bacterium]|nr:ABC transporter substrate-binding protein [Candidatus Krumholzibacteriaceae bacterium]